MKNLDKIILAALLALGLYAGEVEAADSLACQALGAACICNHTMDTNSFTAAPGNQQFEINDGVAKICQFELPNMAISSGGGQTFSGVTSGEDISALPAAHTVTRVLRSNTTTGVFLGHVAESGVPTARRAIQFYKYYSNAYNAQTTSDSSCNANKIAQFGRQWQEGPLFTTEGGTWTIYDINTDLGFNQTVDCCNGPGPGNEDDGPPLSGLLGKWWRYQIITHNASPTGPGTYFELFVKNVTDDEPELHTLDTSQTADAQGWTSSFATGLHVTDNLNAMLINFFRSTNGATPCTGFASYSNYIYAAWDTDAGQRIGAAPEIEGEGDEDTTPPAAPVSTFIVKKVIQ